MSRPDPACSVSPHTNHPVTFKEKLIANLVAKSKALGRPLAKLEIVEVCCETHEAEKPQAKAPRAATSITAGAEQVYQLYPLKVGKDAALRAISVQLKKHELPYLLDKTNQFAQAVASWPSSYRYFTDGGDRCPHPSTWFSQGRYSDDTSTWKRHGAKNPAAHQYVAPKEPMGWRDAFPDFTDRHKEWGQLQPVQHQFILNTLSVAKTQTQPLKEYDSETRLRTA